MHDAFTDIDFNDWDREHIMTNLDFAKRLNTVIRALSIGIKVKIDKQIVLMNHANLFIECTSINTQTNEEKPYYLGMNDVPWHFLVESISNMSDEYIEKLRAEVSGFVVLNRLDLKRKRL